MLARETENHECWIMRDEYAELGRYQLDVNLTGPWLVTKTFVPQ